MPAITATITLFKDHRGERPDEVHKALYDAAYRRLRTRIVRELPTARWVRVGPDFHAVGATYDGDIVELGRALRRHAVDALRDLADTTPVHVQLMRGRPGHQLIPPPVTDDAGAIERYSIG